MATPTRTLLRAHAYAVLVIGFFVVALPRAASSFDAIVPIAVPAALESAGWVLFGLSAGLSYWSFWALVTNGQGTAFPTDPRQLFVAAGPYRYVRNPMYIGNLGMVLAISWAFRSAGVLLYWALMCLVTHLYVVSVEEPRLVARFGGVYEAYRGRVRRWIPRTIPDGSNFSARDARHL